MRQWRGYKKKGTAGPFESGVGGGGGNACMNDRGPLESRVGLGAHVDSCVCVFKYTTIKICKYTGLSHLPPGLSHLHVYSITLG